MDNYQIGKYQTASRRFWAGFVDGLVFMPLGFLDAWIIGTSRSAAILIIWTMISYPAYWLYSVLMHGFYGQTVGKKTVGVKVLDVSESPMSMRQAFLRDAIYIGINTVALVISIYLILKGERKGPDSISTADLILGVGALLWFFAEIATYLMNQKRRAIHDFIAGTVVVNVEHLSLDENAV